MPFQQKPIDSKEFDLSRAQHHHHWTFLGKERGQRPKYVWCRCGICEREKWANWRAIKRGHSTRCRDCKGRPIVSEFNALLELKGIRWRISNLTRRAHKRDGTPIKGRAYWCTCLDCGRSKWLPWAMIQQFKSKRCSSCAQRRVMTGSAKLDPLRPHLVNRWYDVKGRCPHIPTTWKTFEEFRVWAIEKGFRPGMRICRKKKGLHPYSPENCYLVKTKFCLKHQQLDGLGARPRLTY